MDSPEAPETFVGQASEALVGAVPAETVASLKQPKLARFLQPSSELVAEDLVYAGVQALNSRRVLVKCRQQTKELESSPARMTMPPKLALLV